MNTDAQNEEPSTLPKLLYRYLDDRFGVDAVANLELKITPPNEFNDPLEFSPRLSESEAEWNAAYANFLKNGMPPMSLNEFKRCDLKKRKDMAIRPEFRNKVSAHLCTLCLSARPNIGSQWVHYSAGHKGLALELDMKADIFRIWPSEWFCKVRYPLPEKRQPVELHTALQDLDVSGDASKLDKILQICASEKSPEWSAEKEYRLIAAIPTGDSGLKSPIERRLVGGRILYFLKVNLPAVKRVIIGALATVEFEREVRKVAIHCGLRPQQVVRARINPEMFCVETD